MAATCLEVAGGGGIGEGAAVGCCELSEAKGGKKARRSRKYLCELRLLILTFSESEPNAREVAGPL
jgi:hypothetical protein